MKTVILVVAAAALLSSMGILASPARVDQLVRNALQLDPNIKRGKGLYEVHCARCHGAGAIGDARNVIPALAGQRAAYLVKQLADFTELERSGEEMHAVVSKAEINEPQEWSDLAGYVSQLPFARFPETSDGTGVELGEAIFQEQCASCHEEDARGDDDGFIPSLRNQHYSYLVRQMRSLAAAHRLNVDADLVRFIDSLDTEEMTAVADYLSRLRGPVRDRTKLLDDGTLRE
ncbi:MAG TPA: c-type cytochrome [Steroidobacteraceae bacterium]|nr:c-type cytochrome [Steroidobacteraceae bacterium]